MEMRPDHLGADLAIAGNHDRGIGGAGRKCASAPGDGQKAEEQQQNSGNGCRPATHCTHIPIQTAV
jgi:hypothetical protein